MCRRKRREKGEERKGYKIDIGERTEVKGVMEERRECRRKRKRRNRGGSRIDRRDERKRRRRERYGTENERRQRKIKKDILVK